MKTISKTNITATFTKTTAKWNKFIGNFTNKKKHPPKQKTIEIQLAYAERSPKKVILRFIGGPTGHECYYVQDLLMPVSFPKPEKLCICAGTLNSWEHCTVKWVDVINFLKTNGYDIKRGI